MYRFKIRYKVYEYMNITQTESNKLRVIYAIQWHGAMSAVRARGTSAGFRRKGLWFPYSLFKGSGFYKGTQKTKEARKVSFGFVGKI